MHVICLCMCIVDMCVCCVLLFIHVLQVEEKVQPSDKLKQHQLLLRALVAHESRMVCRCVGGWNV